MVNIRTATISDIPAIESVLLASQLPSDGVKEHVANFLVAEDEGKLAGVGGFENCGAGVGLLRSFAVLPEQRNRGIAKQLYQQVITHARRSGISGLYLLTTTAQGYFAKLGFASIARARAPEAIRNTQQFRELCPDSAALMFRSVAAGCGGCATASEPSSTADPEGSSKALFDSGYYCAEAVLLAVAKHNGIESPLIPAIATGFCSGLSRTSGMCGALTGGILGLNLVYGRDREVESVEQNYFAVQRLVAEFGAACGSTKCSELLGCDLGTPEGQQTFRENKLHERCREYTAIATKIAVSLSDGKAQEKAPDLFPAPGK